MILTILHRRIGSRDVTIDDADFDRVKPYRWLLFKRRKVYYLRARIGGKQTLLHRFIMQAPADMTVDHIDGNPLNNSRSNLRICTNEENLKAAWERGAHANKPPATHSNTVKKRLADGTVKTYRYDRRDHRAWDEK